MPFSEPWAVVVKAEKIFAPLDADQNKIAALRAEGRVVIEQLPGQEADAVAMGCEKKLCLIDGQWVIEG